jgi:hypothetical protein
MGCFPANAEFEIITNAIYAAADQPRPLPVADDKPPTRTHFVYRIDIWSDDGRHILEHLAGLEKPSAGGAAKGFKAGNIRSLANQAIVGN